MVALQLINKILSTGDISLLKDNAITPEHFLDYKKEIDYILDHYNAYGNVPDVPTFLDNFRGFTINEVKESDRYLVDKIREEYLYSEMVPVLQKAADMLRTDANEASRYISEKAQELIPQYTTPSVDITNDLTRVEEFKSRSEDENGFCIPTGFQELDSAISGWETKEEFVVFVARTNQGKSWILLKSMEHAWKIGKNVGFISPEMSASRLGYRFDTLVTNFSNRSLMSGDTSDLSVDDYKSYADSLKNVGGKFLVSTPKDFNKQITVTKLRSYIQNNKLDILAIDGITYLSDERFKKGDSKTITLTNISEDLMQLSNECEVPILVVVQSNRGGVKEGENDTPELEDIRDSDGISHNATKVISLKQKESAIVMTVKKNRYGRVGDVFTYWWNIDKGEFEWMADKNDSVPKKERDLRKEELKSNYNSSILF